MEPTMIDKPTRPHLTHATGAPVSDNVNIQTAGFWKSWPTSTGK